MEVGLKKESPITYSNGKRLFTIDQKVDALVRIKMTGCSKAEVARSLHVAESTFRGWFKNKDIVMKAEAKYNDMKTKSSVASSDGYKSDENSTKSFSVDGSDNNSSIGYTDEREGSLSRFSSPDRTSSAHVIRRSPERLRYIQQKHKLKKHMKTVVQNLNNNNSINNNNNGNALNASLSTNQNLNLNGASLGSAINHLLPQQQMHHLAQFAHHPLHQNLALNGLKGPNAAAAAVAAAAAAAAAAVAADHPGLRLNPSDLHTKLTDYFTPAQFQQLANVLPANFLPPNFTMENFFNKGNFLNSVSATLMEPQALDLSTHSRNKCIAPRNPLWQLQ